MSSPSLVPAGRAADGAAPDARRLYMVSLGCPKNRVDSEVMLGVALQRSIVPVSDPADADVIVVNTCGFIESAKKESIDTILELAEHKRAGRCRTLVVAGCLSQRYGPELMQELPEVDHFLGSSDMLRLDSVLGGHAERLLVGNPADWVIRAGDPRRLSTRGASAYLKLGEGCNRSCSFCVIPQMRGKQRSRTPEDVLSEARVLVERGVLELNLVSQDTVAYGRDLGRPGALAPLVAAIADLPGVVWVRLFYLYPEKLEPALIELLAEHPRVLPYVDMPLQHASDSMLRRMKRGHGGARLNALVDRLRRDIPELVMRTAFIVGHPGETEADFDELCDFLRYAAFDRVGVFTYSDEETSASHRLDGKVPSAVAERRARRLMALQRPISRAKNRALVGRDLRVLVEGPSEESELVMVGRHAGQAPDIDGVVYLSGELARPGTIVTARITRATDYDLLGEVELHGASTYEKPRANPGGPPLSEVPRRTASQAAPQPVERSRTLVHRSSDGRKVALKTFR